MSDSAKRFAVYSVGSALPGFSSAEVAQRIAHNTSRTPESIQMRLLSGRSQRVKSFATLEEAEVICERLRLIGLDAIIRELVDDLEHSEHRSFMEPLTDEPLIVSDSDAAANGAEPYYTQAANSESTEPPTLTHTYTDSSYKQARGSRSYVAASVGVLIAMIAIGCAYWWLYPSMSGSANRAEQAMFASAPPSLVVAANIKQIRKLSSLGGNDAGTASLSEMLSTGTLLDVVTGSSKIADQTNHVVMRFSAIKDEDKFSTLEPHPDMIIGGEFAQAPFLAELEKTYQVESQSGGIYKLTRAYELFEGRVCPIDTSVSTQAKTLFIQFVPGHVMAASDATNLARFKAALAASDDNEDPAFLAWQAYRGNALVAAQLNNFDAMPGGLFGRALLDSVGSAPSIEQLGLLVDSAPLSRGIKVSLDLFGSNNGSLTNAANSIRQSLSESRVQYAQSHPSVVDILTRIDLTDTDGLHLQLTLDSDLLSEVNRLSSEVTSMMFGGGSLRMGNESQEQLVNSVWNFASNSQFVAETPYQLGSFDKFKPSYEQGSHAIFIGGVGLKPSNSFSADAWTKDLTMQLELVAKRSGPDITDDVSDSGIQYSLMVDDVLNKQGQSLLADETCLRRAESGGRNHEPSIGSQYQARAFEVRKSVRLVSGAKMTDIGQIIGKVELFVPTQVASRTMSLQGERLLALDASVFRLAGIEGGSVQYSIDGDESEIVALRAKNANGDVLRSQGKMSMAGSTAHSFAGEVASIEVFYTTESTVQSQEFEFEFQRPEPVAIDDNPFGAEIVPSTPVFATADTALLAQRLDVATLSKTDQETIDAQFQWEKLALDGTGENGIGLVTTPSALLYFAHNKTTGFFNSQLKGKVIIPHVPSIMANPDTVFLDLKLNDVDVLNVPVSFSKSTFNGKALPSLELEAGAYDMGSFQVDVPQGIEQFTAISGVLRFEIPTAVTQRPIPFSQGRAPRSVLNLLGYEYGWNTKVRYQLAQDVPGLSAAYLEYANGRVGAANVLDASNPILEFSSIGEPRKITIVSIESKNSITEFFELTPRYGG